MSDKLAPYIPKLLELLNSKPKELTEEEREARAKIVRIVSDNIEGKRFAINHIHARLVGEQNLFWQRFTAFSALNAGLFVLAASTSLQSVRAMKLVGAGLGLAWSAIQWLSLRYTKRDKNDYYSLCNDLTLPHDHSFSLELKFLNTNRIATGVSIATFAVWLAWLFKWI